MDPYVATIIRQAAVLSAAVGALVALAYGVYQYSRLQYASALNMMPPQVQ